MCDWCKNVETGDDYYPLIADTISLGFFGECDFNIYLGRTIDDHFPALIQTISQIEGNNEASTVQSIHYCPMCGEKLR